MGDVGQGEAVREILLGLEALIEPRERSLQLLQSLRDPLFREAPFASHARD
ncbi:MAG: hypothetical protein AVDCRST_MAG55-913 [uncultured Rubrobacteraceae bacterium]|uniref:Uncharacterized protein n=1 Tax=uncultured Rubrobacteraceae bacterium TaxID=349277 RepID=A0A6J4PBL0_9ACTN|nr:MAG: hypothetical protein AVDCRST_MAG55-913 [uncultured Rubrobacteraceae bacterium]